MRLVLRHVRPSSVLQPRLGHQPADQLRGIVHQRNDPGVVQSGRTDHADRAHDLLRARHIGRRDHSRTEREKMLSPLPMKMRTPWRFGVVQQLHHLSSFVSSSSKSVRTRSRSSAARGRSIRLAWPRTITARALASRPAWRRPCRPRRGGRRSRRARRAASVGLGSDDASASARVRPGGRAFRKLAASRMRDGVRPGGGAKTRFSTWPSARPARQGAIGREARRIRCAGGASAWARARRARRG